jgi:hypothetical protein
MPGFRRLLLRVINTQILDQTRFMTAFQAFLLRIMNISELAEGVWCSTGIFNE